jgi:hypothetical protein
MFEKRDEGGSKRGRKQRNTHVGDVGEGSVRCGEEVTARCWDERSDDADEVVVHVARVSKGRRRGGHDRRDLV